VSCNNGQGSTQVSYDGSGGVTLQCVTGSPSPSPSPTPPNTFPVGNHPVGIAFDGTHMWVTNENDNTVTELNPDGSAAGTFGVGTHPKAIAFDGTHMWVANSG
jgi:DNA-binding beta-propeller fold protein YncE